LAKDKKQTWPGGMAQVVEFLASETLSVNPSTAKKKKKKKKLA
jgi:hypothetical protein